MSKRQILIIAAITLITLGMVLMIQLKDHKYGYILGGAIIGGGFGIIPSLFSKKKEE
ncbi:hypothetical protein [Winogradskyella sp. PE311]|uniref:hypothetical protein n=1 Tax=Winogradskyella sp. PE311 TaxID=3366943 RepID=UPI00397F06F5